MRLLNFAQPLTEGQKTPIGALAAAPPIARVIAVPVHFDNEGPFGLHGAQLVAHLPRTPAGWQTELIVVNSPALNCMTARPLADLPGPMGCFPPMVRLRPVPGVVLPCDEVAEILNSQAGREAARQGRFGG